MQLIVSANKVSPMPAINVINESFQQQKCSILLILTEILISCTIESYDTVFQLGGFW